MNAEVVITDHTFDNLDATRELLRPFDITLSVYQCRSEDDVMRATKNAVAVLVNLAPIGRDVIQQMSRCKIIARYGAGYDNVDIREAKARGIYVTNVPAGSTDEVADHTLAVMLSLLRKIPQARELTRQGVWDATQVMPLPRLRGLRLGLVGFGRIARAVAERALSFGMRVMASDPCVDDAVFESAQVAKVSLDDLLSMASVVSIHAPLNEATRHLIGRAELNRMKPDAYLINTSRGSLIDEQALIEALEHGRLAGAALDVLEVEPPAATNRLLALEQVIVTCHCAGYSTEQQRMSQSAAAEQVVAVLEGRRPSHTVN
jgi:D-3-phosphoglycerate dehydrogenase / 2-oxoglutarate reductase